MLGLLYLADNNEIDCVGANFQKVTVDLLGDIPIFN